MCEGGAETVGALKTCSDKKAANHAAPFIDSGGNCAGLNFIYANFSKILILECARDFFGEIIRKAEAEHGFCLCYVF